MNFEAMKQKDLALAVGVATKTVQRWTESGMPRNEDDSYSLPLVVEWLVDRGRSEVTTTDTDSDRWLGKYREERARIAKLEREQLEKKLCPVAEVEAAFTDRAFELSRGLCLMSRRIAHRIAGKSKKAVKAVSAIVDEEVRGMMDTYSKPIDLEFEVLKK